MKLKRACVAVVTAEDATPAGLVDQEALHAAAPRAHGLASAALAAIAPTAAGSRPRRKSVESAFPDDDRLIALYAVGTCTNRLQAVAPEPVTRSRRADTKPFGYLLNAQPFHDEFGDEFSCRCALGCVTFSVRRSEPKLRDPMPNRRGVLPHLLRDRLDRPSLRQPRLEPCSFHDPNTSSCVGRNFGSTAGGGGSRRARAGARRRGSSWLPRACR
jgi:hypothetical protein